MIFLATPETITVLLEVSNGEKIHNNNNNYVRQNIFLYKSCHLFLSLCFPHHYQYQHQWHQCIIILHTHGLLCGAVALLKSHLQKRGAGGGRILVLEILSA